MQEAKEGGKEQVRQEVRRELISECYEIGHHLDTIFRLNINKLSKL